MSHHWDSSLCGCLDDCGVCCCVFFCPLGFLCVHVKATTKASGGGCCGPCCRAVVCCCFGCAMNRKRVRHEADVKGSFWKDCCTWLYCSPCAASQEYREMKHVAKKDKHGHH